MGATFREGDVVSTSEVTTITSQAQPHIDRYRSAAQALRGIRSHGGRTGATIKAIRGWEGRQIDAIASLMDLGCGKIVGVLVEEEGLAERIRIARCSHQERPELAERLREARAFLRAWLK